MRKKIFTFLLALAASVGMGWASVTWISDEYGNYEEKGYYAGTPFTKDGVTVTMSDDAFFIVSYWGDASLQCVKGTFGPTAGNYVFSNSLGENFVKIIIAAGYTSDWEWFPKGDGWVLSGDEDNGYILTWTGNASTVTLMDNELHSVNQSIEGDIVFYFESDSEEPDPVLVTANTLQLHVNDALMGSLALQNPSNDIIDNGDGTYDVPEGAEVTLLATPNEGYEFIGWKAGNVGCDFTDCGTALSTVDNPLTFDMNNEVAFMAEFAAVASQPQIGPKEVLDLGTTGCVGEHYQLTGGGTNIYRTVGGVDNKMITIESLHGEIIDNISLKLYYYNVWTGYSVAASSGDVSSWNYDAYEDLVITNINATSVTLSRVGSGQENGYVMFEKVTINNSDEPEPQPAEDVNIIPNVDPDHAGVYYSTFYDSANKYALPANVEAYVATRDGANLLLSKIADAGQTIPADNAVILKSTVTPFTLSISDAEAVTFTATNDLQGTDESINTPANCYVLAGNDGVGFYHYTASMLNPHKAYVIYSGSQAPHRMPFVFNQATGVENVQGDNVQSTKVIENGVLYIIKNGVKYNAMGQPVNQ